VAYKSPTEGTGGTRSRSKERRRIRLAGRPLKKGHGGDHNVPTKDGRDQVSRTQAKEQHARGKKKRYPMKKRGTRAKEKVPIWWLTPPGEEATAHLYEKRGKRGGRASHLRGRGKTNAACISLKKRKKRELGGEEGKNAETLGGAEEKGRRKRRASRWGGEKVMKEGPHWWAKMPRRVVLCEREKKSPQFKVEMGVADTGGRIDCLGGGGKKGGVLGGHRSLRSGLPAIRSQEGSLAAGRGKRFMSCRCREHTRARNRKKWS